MLHPLCLTITVLFMLTGTHAIAVVKVILAGDTVTFTCHTPSPSAVWHQQQLQPHPATASASSPRREPIFNGNKVAAAFAPRFSVAYSAEERVSRLRIDGVQKSDAGGFDCMDKETGRILANGSLTVIEREPQCSKGGVIQPKPNVVTVEISCSVCYVGHISPSVECSAGEVSPSSRAERTSTNNSSCWSYIEVYSVGDRRLHAAIFKCSVLFAEKEHVYYNYTWTALPLDLGYDIAGATIYPHDQTTFRDGDKLTCVAIDNNNNNNRTTDNNIDYHWVVHNNYLQLGPILTVNACQWLHADDGKEQWTAQTTAEAVQLDVMCVARRGKLAVTITKLTTFQRTELQRCVTSMKHKEVQTVFSVPTIVLGLLLAIVVIISVLQQIRYQRYKSYTDKLYVHPISPRRSLPLPDSSRSSGTLGGRVVTVTSAAAAAAVYDELSPEEQERNRQLRTQQQQVQQLQQQQQQQIQQENPADLANDDAINVEETT